jgi:hypothetical protein
VAAIDKGRIGVLAQERARDFGRRGLTQRRERELLCVLLLGGS